MSSNDETICPHLAAIKALADASGARITAQGKLWSDNCRMWICYDGFFDRVAIRAALAIAPCVEDHEHLGTHDGSEAGFYCTTCHDAVVGVHGKDKAGRTCIG